MVAALLFVDVRLQAQAKKSFAYFDPQNEGVFLQCPHFNPQRVSMDRNQRHSVANQ